MYTALLLPFMAGRKTWQLTFLAKFQSLSILATLFCVSEKERERKTRRKRYREREGGGVRER